MERLVKVPMEPFSWRSVSPRAIAALAGLVLLRAAVYVHFGVQLVNDDWGFVYRAVRRHGLGNYHARTRPAAWLVESAIYNGVGPHPLVLFVIVTLLNLVAAWLLYVVTARFVRSRTAFFVAALWVLVANHNTLTVWTATAPTLFALVLVLAGVLWLTNGRWVVAAVCLGVSVLAYELTIPACLAAAFIVPSSRPLQWKQRLGTAVPTVAATLWVVTHPTYESQRIPTPDISQFWRAHFSDGLLATSSPPDHLVYLLADIVIVGLVCCLVAWVAGQRGREEGPWLALCGAFVVLLGSAGFLRVGLGPRSVGYFDRLLALSSIGSVMILVGIAQLVWRRSHLFAGVSAVLLCLVLAAGQFVSLRSWAAAGADAVDALDVAVGPRLRDHNGIPSTSTDFDMLALAYDLRFGSDAGTLRTVDSPAEFVPSRPGELLLDWTWIDNAAVFDEGVGFVAAVTVPGPGQAMVYGWVEDGPPDADPVEVEFLVDGRSVGRTTADGSRADLAASLGRANPNHAFEQLVDVPGGEHEVCARTMGHGNVSLGCETVHVLPR